MATPLTPNELWKIASDDLQTTLSPGTFTMWIKTSRITEIKDVGEDRKIITLATNSPYHYQMLEDRLYAQIKDALDRITGKKNELQFTMSVKKDAANISSAQATPSSQSQ